MATYVPYSQSPRVSGEAIPQSNVQNTALITPVHSPHHSVTSSASSRTPIHTLSIHEYRKQLHTPSSRTATPVGKTLRRKAAAPALNPIQRDTPPQLIISASRAPLRPLHISQSAQQLHSHRPPFQQLLLADQLTRAQSAEPRTQGGSVSSISTINSAGRVSHFKTRKRLPKPPLVTGSLPPPHLANVKPNLPRRPHLATPLEFSRETSHSSGTPTPHTTSTFSLSRFPKPPHLTDPSFSPPHNESERTRINALSYATTAPATPPATPATLHYRGASFDLVNPHDSLLLHNIVTPSREFDSSEYLAGHSSTEPFLDLAEMAPKRALYGDFTTAHAGILKRTDVSYSTSEIDLPQPPNPAALSPDSSAYTSPMYSPESHFAPPPLAVHKASPDSRFSLKQLTRTLTNKLGKTPEKQKDDGRELQELSVPKLRTTSASTKDESSRPLQNTYISTPQSAYFPIHATSPDTPTSPMTPEFEVENEIEIEQPRRHPVQRYDSEPLASLIPSDDYSTQVGRIGDARVSMSDGHLLSRPYYDDLDSIYPSSSIYTGDGRRQSNYQQSLMGARQSNPFVRYSGVDASSFAYDYNQDSLCGYATDTRRASKPLSREMYHYGYQGKTDTISKIIDQYDPNATTENTLSVQSREATGGHEAYSNEQLASLGRQRDTKSSSGFAQFEFGLNRDMEDDEQNYAGARLQTVEPNLSRIPTVSRNAGLPPREPLPLAPPFSHGDEHLGFGLSEQSEMFASRSSYSYGDTRNLLQMPPSDDLIQPRFSQALQTSSSYSQPGVTPMETVPVDSKVTSSSGPHTPQEALDQADDIFRNASEEQQRPDAGIPAMWARRSSGSQLIAKRASGQGTDNRKSAGIDSLNEWESVAGHSQGIRESFDSIADYSSSDSTRNSLGLNSDGSLPSWIDYNHSRGPSAYSHPSPIRAHYNPFSSSPPQLRPQGRVNTAPQTPSSPLASSPPASTTVPVLRISTHFDDTPAEKPYGTAPWMNKYAFSDKETEELLASGPNDNIIIENRRESAHKYGYPLSSSPENPFDAHNALQRDNTFEKLCVIGPKGNLTGTPQGTGMNETGSSVADTSSPFTPSATRERLHQAKYPGFYATPFAVTGSITKIHQVPPPIEPEYERTPSQVTLFPRSTELEPVVETSPTAGASHRHSVRSSTTFQNAQGRVRRPSVKGQTKLRQMRLANEVARKTLSSADTNFSRFMGGSERPSTSDTNTPLRPHISVGVLPTARTLVAHEHSPHLLCPERATNPEDEERRRKLSWAILACFCFLPPCIILYRFWGDSLMISISKGQLGHCTNKSKKVALIAGIAVNVGMVTAIVVPIIVAHALGLA